MILLLYHFSLKKLNILKKENLILLSEIKNVTKDFQKKSLEILGEKQLLSDNLDKQLLAIVEEKKSLQRLLEICELTSQEDLKRMTYQLHQVRNKFQSIMDQVSNKTE
jgi:predicted MarR family transcription regulator